MSKQYVCDCGKSYAGKKWFEKHKQKAHGQFSAEAIKAIEVQKFGSECTYCLSYRATVRSQKQTIDALNILLIVAESELCKLKQK